MNRHLKSMAVCSLALLLFLSCNAIERIVNPFLGNWEAGAVKLEFNSDRSFELTIGQTISVNLEGKYDYDKQTLILDIEGDSKVEFSYEFKDDDKKLILKPKSEFSYIKTTIEFSRK